MDNYYTSWQEEIIKKILSAILIIVFFLMLISGVLYYWFPGIIFKTTVYAVRLWAGLQRHEVQINDHRWVYLTGGDGETILFVHGFGAGKEGWGNFLSAFSGSYRVVAPDLPGLSESCRIPSAKYDIPTQVERLNEFVEFIELETFHLIGFSMGGYISVYYASIYPEKVKSLAIIDAPGVELKISSDAWQRYKQGEEIILLYKTKDQFNDHLKVLFHRPPWLPDRLKLYLIKKGASNYTFYERILNDMVKGGMALLENRLSKIRVKTLIIWGANDRIIHVSSVKKFERGLINNQTVIIEDCGHVPHLEKPSETKRTYKKFLASVISQ